jgi:hypothetical protein
MNDLGSLEEALVNLIKECLENPESAREFIARFGGKKPSPDTQPSVQRAVRISKDPTKATLVWLKGKQWIKYELVEEKPPVPINGGVWTPNNVYEYRIRKTVAFIYRGLVKAAENGEIPLVKDTIIDFMINNLKNKDGGDITHDSLTKAEKSRQNQTK